MLRLILPLLLALSSPLSQADTAPLGRLFFDAQQRANLDQQRQRNPWLGQQNADDAETGLTFNGEVRSSSGRRTRWINGEADWNGTAQIPRVPVGDTFNPSAAEHQSVLGSGKIIVKPTRMP